MEKIISNKVRKNLNEHTARIILERSDRMASSTLEQLRKSTDRAYTMTGFLLTVFIALTAFVFSSPSLWQLSTAVVLYIMVNQVLWVHPFRHTGNEPRNMIQEENIDRLLKNGHNQEEMNALYSINTLLDAISNNQEIIDRNKNILANRCDQIEKAMTVIRCTVIIATIITAISLLASALGMYHGSAI